MTDIQEYKIVINILLIMPFVLITILYFFLKDKKWKIRYPVMILSGWVFFLIFVVSLTTYSVTYAPTEELMKIAVDGDGAPNVFTLLFGWIYALVFLLFLETINKVIFYIQRFFDQET